jgi:hypothetical protein
LYETLAIIVERLAVNVVQREAEGFQFEAQSNRMEKHVREEEAELDFGALLTLEQIDAALEEIAVLDDNLRRHSPSSTRRPMNRYIDGRENRNDLEDIGRAADTAEERVSQLTRDVAVLAKGHASDWSVAKGDRGVALDQARKWECALEERV